MTRSRFAVVGCRKCDFLWIVEDYREQVYSECPRCERTYRTRKLRPQARANTFKGIAESRARLLADRSGHLEEYREMGHYAEQGEQAEDVHDQFVSAFEDELADTVREHRDVLADQVSYESVDSYGFDESSIDEHRRRFEQLADDVAGSIVSLEDELDHYYGADRSPEPAPELEEQSTSTSDRDGPPNAGVAIAKPTGQSTLSETVLSRVSPRRSEWIPDLLEELLPTTSQTIRDLAWEFDPRTISENRNWSSFVRDRLLEDVIDEAGYLAAGSPDTNAAVVHYLETLVAASIDEDVDDAIRETLTATGTGRGPFNAGIDALEHGFVRVHRERQIAPTVALLLDGEEWINTDNETVERALEAIDLLGAVLDVRLVASPALVRYLERHFEGFCESVTGLTEPEDTSGVPAPTSSEGHDQDVLREAWDRLGELDEAGGRIRLLANLDEDGSREVRDLRQDDEIGLAAGSIDRYVGDLEALEVVSVDDCGRYNSVSLTRLGSAAVQWITDDYRVRHPLQSQLDAPYADPPFGRKYSVTGALGMPPGDRGEAAGGRQGPATAEEWLAETGDPAEGAPYVRWIDSGPSKTLDAWGMHDRLRAARRVDGVNLVDHEIPALEDGRVAYLSDFEDHTQVVVQWGGSLPTLTRLSAALLSDRAFSKILEPSTVGSAFSNLFEGHLADEIESVIQRGMQVGWFSEDELQYEDFRERWGHVRAELLERMGELVGTRDYELRRDLFRRLHGLLASTTALYRAIGKDVTIHIRMPDTRMLTSDEGRLGDFLDFMRYTVPKQTAYGIHSGNRMLLEHRPDKLRRRLPVDVQADDPTMDLSASWVVTGPQASLLQEDLEEAIGANDDDVREAVADGTETAPAMEIPVAVANEFGAIKAEVSRHLERKGFRAARDDVVSLTRACMAVLGTETRGASPYDVASALLHLKKKPGMPLTVAQLENAIAMLPADRLLRDQKPTVQKMFKAILEANEPMGRSKLIEAAGISSNSYDRNWHDLLEFEAFGLVSRNSDKKWRARLIPFWSDVGSIETPEDFDGFVPSSAVDVLFEAAYELHDDVPYALFEWPVDLDEVVGTFEWQHWRPLLVYLDDDLFENRMTARLGGPSKIGVGGPSKTVLEDDGAVAIATIGRRPPGADRDQRSLVDELAVSRSETSKS